MILFPVHIQRILEQRYIRENDQNWEGIVTRVSKHVASCEKETSKWEEEFRNIIEPMYFVPGGRILSNAGFNNQLMNCAVTSVENSLEEIFIGTLYQQMRLYSRSGSSGFNFSKLTSRGQKTNRGFAAGPVGFMSLVSKVASVIYQESTRNPGSMGILSIHHPDIMEFIQSKNSPDKINQRVIDTYRNFLLEYLPNFSEYPALIDKLQQVLSEATQFPNFNISVGITDEFLNSLDDALIRHSIEAGPYSKQYSKDELFNAIAKNAWKSGEPGILFLDTINKHHPLLDTVDTCNVCGEQMLLTSYPAGESCCLGALNLHDIFIRSLSLIRTGQSPMNAFKDYLSPIIRTAVRFLDNVIDVTDYATDDYERIQKRNRKIGLGIMGWADLLLELQIPYGSETAQTLALDLGRFIQEESYKASQALAKEKGYDTACWTEITEKNIVRNLAEDALHAIPRRNTCLNTIAPTGSTSLIAQTSSGVEPWFDWRFVRYDETAPDGQVYEWHPAVVSYCEKQGVDDIEDFVASGRLPEYFQKASDLTPKQHIDMVAAWQQFIDSSISKTINCPKETTVADIKDLILYAYEKGCKAFTVYREGSREFEVLKKVGSIKSKKETELRKFITSGRPITESARLLTDPLIPNYVRDWSEKDKRFAADRGITVTNSESTVKIRQTHPDRRAGTVISIPTGYSTLHVTITEDNKGNPIEVFLNLGKAGSDEAAAAEAVGRLISVWLQRSTDPKTVMRLIATQLTGIGGFKQRHHNGSLVRSIWDGLGKVLLQYLEEPIYSFTEEIQDNAVRYPRDFITCNQCHQTFLNKNEKCPTCPHCGFSECS